MAQTKAVIIPNGASRVLVCIDSITDEEPAGRWYNPFCSDPVEFESVLQLLCSMEDFYNEMSFPQCSVQRRSWNAVGRPPGRAKRKEVKRFMSDEVFTQNKGDRATFVVQVQFRQNATWQGTVTWAEKNEIQHFRSVLELIRLMDDSLREGEEKSKASGAAD